MRCAAWMRQFRAGKPRDDFLQRGACRLRVLRQLEMPVGELVHRGGDLFGRRRGRIAKKVQRDFRAGQILQVFGLDAGQQHYAFKIVRETGKLLLNFDHRFQRFFQLPFGQGDGIIGFGFRWFVAAVHCAGQRPGDGLNNTVPPSDDHGQSADQHQNQSAGGCFSHFSKIRNDHEQYECNDDGGNGPFENQPGAVIAAFEGADEQPGPHARYHRNPENVARDLPVLTHD